MIIIMLDFNSFQSFFPAPILFGKIVKLYRFFFCFTNLLTGFMWQDECNFYIKLRGVLFLTHLELLRCFNEAIKRCMTLATRSKSLSVSHDGIVSESLENCSTISLKMASGKVW